MRILLSLLILLPISINADCGCQEVEQELEEERKADLTYHGCRSCKGIDVSDSACPATGYECKEDWKITSNILSASGRCQCSEARCVGRAKLAFKGKLVHKV
ncbi:hypothetical protein PENTCL1PPCAC_5033, partial [Pristionchus entomophagus]